MSMHASFGAEAVPLKDAFVSRLKALTEVTTKSTRDRNVKNVCKITRNKQYCSKVLLSSFHLDVHTLGLHPQIQS